MTLDPRRAGRITGSRVAGILGLSPYATRASVMRDMVRQHIGLPDLFTGNEATRYGEAHEPDALAAYEAREGVMTYGGGELLIHPVHDFLAVTPDGLVGDDGMIECKAPFRATYTHWNEKPYYEAQMRLQMECAGRAWCDFVVWRDGKIAVSRIERDATWLPSVLPVMEQFMAEYREIIADPARCEEMAGSIERDDPEWVEAARQWLHAKAMADDYAALEKQAKAALEALAPGGASGAGVRLTRVERAGSIAYAKALKALAPDADLEPYRGKPTSYFTASLIDPDEPGEMQCKHLYSSSAQKPR